MRIDSVNTTSLLTEDQRDCLQETINVAMGQAGDALARILNVFIHLSVPMIRSVGRDNLNEVLQEFVGHEPTYVSAVRQGFYSVEGANGLRGECIVLFNDASYRELAELMAYDGDLLERVDRELLLDAANILCGACLNGIAKQLDESLTYTPPNLLGCDLKPEKIIDLSQVNWDQILLIAINYRLEHRQFNCTMMLMLPPSAIATLISHLDRILEAL
jgi:chemotaxis protein CheY-P-specific phosphatase CheC